MTDYDELRKRCDAFIRLAQLYEKSDDEEVRYGFRRKLELLKLAVNYENDCWTED